MFVEIFSICDAATDSAGKLNILGTFEGIAAPKAPVSRERCSVAVRMRFVEEEAGEHTIQVQLVDKEGTRIGPGIGAKLNVKFTPGRPSIAQNLVLNINNLQFPAFGVYELQLWVDGVKKSYLPIIVAKTQSASRMRGAMEN
ncbi:DUF6941 family protein [Pelagicoccus mobilis]|uniref:Uncharacterized protein n=1 Tax=Pelagicoccus mobilis TaxID=415221 RepID=A0A934VQ22_9BACT|nr:hypothetical protein [Pelagicoccus mobilis]MBK1876079.1 hypothetical protein [Pelagicoccus mobilis]